MSGGSINIQDGAFKVTTAGRVSFDDDNIYINPNDSIKVKDETFSGALSRINSGSNIVVNADLPVSKGWSGGITDRVPYMMNTVDQWLLYVKKGIVVGYTDNENAVWYW